MQFNPESPQQNLKILITGGDGFLGRRLSKAFSELNIETVSYDILNKEDILNYDQLKSKCQKYHITTLIHLAAVADLNIFAKNIEQSNRINIEGTKNVLRVCNELEIRLLFASTCCCYGNNGIHPSDETSPIAPTEEYAQSKGISEQHILADNPKKNHVIMRLATFYGPMMRSALAPAVFLTKAHKQETITIHGDGKQTRTLTYVDDIVSGIIVIATSQHKYDIINITNDEEISVNVMAKTAIDLVGKETEIVYGEQRKGQIFVEQLKNQRLRDLGWEPKVYFQEGMKLSYEFFKENNYAFF